MAFSILVAKCGVNLRNLKGWEALDPAIDYAEVNKASIVSGHAVGVKNEVITESRGNKVFYPNRSHLRPLATRRRREKKC